MKPLSKVFYKAHPHGWIALQGRVYFCSGLCYSRTCPAKCYPSPWALAGSLSKSLVEKKLLRLQANDLAIRDLTGLEHATNLESLVLRDNLIDDLSPIRTCLSLKTSTFRVPADQSSHACSLGSSFASYLKSFRIGLGLSGIDGFRALAQLDVSSNALIDLEGVGKLRGLVNLYAQGNQLGRVEKFADRNRNKEFDVDETFTDESGNGKRDTDPLIELKGMPKLASLHLYDNRIVMLDQLSDLPSLHTLLLSGNMIEEILPLSL